MKSKMFHILKTLPLLFYSTASSAHIKWFVEVDVSEAPRNLAYVLSPMFWGFLGLASVLLFVVFFLDVKWSRWGKFDFIEKRFVANPDIVTAMVRIGTGVFFFALWMIGDVILTPELVTDSGWISSIQLLTAFFTLFRPTLILSGAGILILYSYGIMEYGIFHMLDYTLFLGIAAYLIITSIDSERLLNHRLPLLVVFMLSSFLWVSIEKFGYPNWFDPFLDQNEFLTMGLPRDFFLMSAAFVEFTLVYVLLTGRNIVVLGSVALNLIIVAGALYFGKIDTLGHFLVMVILIIMTIKGANSYRIIPDKRERSALVQANYMVLGYWASLILFFALYYGIHWMQYQLP